MFPIMVWLNMVNGSYSIILAIFLFLNYSRPNLSHFVFTYHLHIIYISFT